METLIIDADGKVTIPPKILHNRGLRPGDELALVESAEGLLLYQGGADSESMDWWNSLSEEERHLAREEARRYDALSEQDRDTLWQEEIISIEEDAEVDEIDLPTRQQRAA